MADQSNTTTQTQAAPEVPPDLSAEKMLQDNLLLLGVIFFIFYFLLIRPHQKRVNQHKELMKSLVKGNKVLTSGGMIGAITKFEGEDIVILEIAQGVRVRVSRASISEVLSDSVGVESANDN